MLKKQAKKNTQSRIDLCPLHLIAYVTPILSCSAQNRYCMNIALQVNKTVIAYGRLVGIILVEVRVGKSFCGYLTLCIAQGRSALRNAEWPLLSNSDRGKIVADA